MIIQNDRKLVEQNITKSEPSSKARLSGRLKSCFDATSEEINPINNTNIDFDGLHDGSSAICDKIQKLTVKNCFKISIKCPEKKNKIMFKNRVIMRKKRKLETDFEKKRQREGSLEE